MSPSKTEQLAEVGINKRTAERYEELAGPREKKAQEETQPCSLHADIVLQSLCANFSLSPPSAFSP
jgi:hypothetical protein